MNKEIYLIRHGRTDYNRLGIWQGSGVDSSLDTEGQEQAASFLKMYGGVDFDVVFHSTLRRSKETIQGFIDKGIAAIESPLIREISWGKFEGKPHTDESLASYRSVVDAWSKEEYEVGFPGGESALDLHDRLYEFVEMLKESEDKKVLICSHGRAIRGLLCVMQGEPMNKMEKYQHANTGLFKGRQVDGAITFESLNNIDHLRE